jgi:5-methylcytosine-specific restriction protein B
MTKKILKEYCNELKVWENWLNSYREFVPQFIDEAKTKKNWQEWDKDIFFEFFECSNDQCVSSLRQGYFTREEQEKIKSNWNQIAPLLKIIAENQDSPDWKTYQELKKIVRQFTTQDRKAATNRLVASLQPNLISTIVSENDLGDLINKINTYTTSNISLDGDWFTRSYNVCKLFQQELKPENPMDIITYPWQFLKHLREINSSLIDKQKEMESIIKLIQANKNLILTGAPGTGKTYKTAEIAVALIDGSDKIPINRADLMKRYKELINAKQIAFTTFHQSLDYEEFIEGLKPEIVENTREMTYQIKDGIFKDICDRAKEKRSMASLNEAIEQFKEDCSDKIIKVKNKSGTEFSVTYRDGKTFRVRSDKSEAKEGVDFPTNIDAIKKMYQGNEDGIYNKTYVWGILKYLKEKYKVADYSADNTDKKYLLIIDEINRGNISKIFGELITLLEKDKRLSEENEITVTLPYSKETFGVPSNLFLLGTMNSADRSIGHIDYAIRRRFSFVSLKSDKNVISTYDKYDSDVKEKAEGLFEEIKDLISTNINADLDVDDLMVGHSYFLCKTADDLKMRLEYEIIPLIEEYEKDGIIMLDKSATKTKFEKWKNLLS